MDRSPRFQPAEIEGELAADAIIRFGRFLFAVRGFDQLLGAERDEHADHDDAHFADKRPPAMQRLWQMQIIMQPSAVTGA